MPLDMGVVLGQVRDLLAAVTGLDRVYAPSESDANRLPATLAETPAVLVIPGPSTEYILGMGQQRHSYEVRAQVLHAAGDYGAAANALMPIVDRIIAKFEVNVGLGGRANQCIFRRQSGLQDFDYGDSSYPGYEITLAVSEQGPASPAFGA